MSPAVCGRGLKLLSSSPILSYLLSPAVCGRGLKLDLFRHFVRRLLVARRVRAWIETLRRARNDQGRCVARRVRAWIETTLENFRIRFGSVARRVRAWIETEKAWIAIQGRAGRPPCAGVD